MQVLKSACAACDLEIGRQAQDVSALADRLADAHSTADTLRARVLELEALRYVETALKQPYIARK